MKNMFLILIISLMSLGCSNNNDDPQNNIPAELIGKWKIVERFTSDGTSGYWHSYDSGEIHDLWFKNNGEVFFTSLISTPCYKATYTVINNEIWYSNSTCIADTPNTIELLTENELLIDFNFFEPMKTRYIKVIE